MGYMYVPREGMQIAGIPCSSHSTCPFSSQPRTSLGCDPAISYLHCECMYYATYTASSCNSGGAGDMIPGRKGMILSTGSLAPASSGNLSNSPHWSREETSTAHTNNDRCHKTWAWHVEQQASPPGTRRSRCISCRRESTFPPTTSPPVRTPGRDAETIAN